MATPRKLSGIKPDSYNISKYMSLEQVESFYEMLGSEPTMYELYQNNCCQRGIFDSCHWDKAKIVNFAANLGYNFTEGELEELLFASEPIRLVSNHSHRKL